MTGTPLARERRHTLHFLSVIRDISPVFLDTEVEMTAVRAHQQAARAAGQRYSVATYLLYVAGRVLAAHPEANTVIRGRRRPRITRPAHAAGKLTFDRVLDGHRVVAAAVLSDVDRSSLDVIQGQVAYFRDGDTATMPEFQAMRNLQRLPLPLGRAAYRLAVRSLHRRSRVFGTFAVTTLGHRPVDGFYSVGGTTVTFGLGQVAERAVVRDGRLTVAPVARLSLTFDHRVIDGAEAADVLAEVKAGLEDPSRPPYNLVPAAPAVPGNGAIPIQQTA